MTQLRPKYYQQSLSTIGWNSVLTFTLYTVFVCDRKVFANKEERFVLMNSFLLNGKQMQRATCGFKDRLFFPFEFENAKYAQTITPRCETALSCSNSYTKKITSPSFCLSLVNFFIYFGTFWRKTILQRRCE